VLVTSSQIQGTEIDVRSTDPRCPQTASCVSAARRSMNRSVRINGAWGPDLWSHAAAARMSFATSRSFPEKVISSFSS
jgi:hypothetical protein